MTNRDYFLKDNVSARELFIAFKEYGCRHNCFLETNEFEQFMQEQVTPTLTKDEKVKEMVYTNERKREVLATGYYFGLLYYVLSLGTHPTAYVKIPKDNWLCSVENYDDIPIECHGGLTFRADHLCIADNQAIEGEFIGWDYAHCTDYAPYYDEEFSKDTHKWTTKEILEEVKEVCYQIVELGKKPHLTEDERVILRNIPKEYIKIRREKYTKNIYVEKEKVEKEEDWEILLVFNHLFQFIKERRRIFY